MEKEFLTMNEVAEFLQVSRMTVYRYFKAGLVYHKLRRSVRIKRTDLDEFIRRGRKNETTHKARKRNR